MLLTITILLIIAIFLIIKIFIIYKKNKQIIKNIISELEMPLRYGYFTKSLTLKDTSTGKPYCDDFDSYIYVKEIDRYTNGTSKIEITKIETGFSSKNYSTENIEKFIRNTFISIVDTNSITWLESENEIKVLRRSKLERLKKLFK